MTDDGTDPGRLYAAIRDRALFHLPAEHAHDLALQGMRTGQQAFRLPGGHRLQEALTRRFSYDDPDGRLEREVDGTTVPTPVGLAPGFDKSARAVPALAALGFGSVAVGGVTAEPQRGNATGRSDGERLLRPPGHRALLNSMGFNNDGAARVGDRLDTYAEQYGAPRPVGINLGQPNPDAGEPRTYPDEIRETVNVLDARLPPDQPAWLTVNVSCPNLEDDLVQADHTVVRDAVDAARDALDATDRDPALYVKIGPPDVDPAANPGRFADRLGSIVDAVDGRADGFVAINTRGVDVEAYAGPDRADTFWTDTAGLSGDPIYDTMLAAVETLHRDAPDATVIASGGISTGEKAYAAIARGADLVQLYTGFVYRGPGTAAAISRELDAALTEAGYAHVGDAVGAATRG